MSFIVSGDIVNSWSKWCGKDYLILMCFRITKRVFWKHSFVLSRFSQKQIHKPLKQGFPAIIKEIISFDVPALKEKYFLKISK
jgi:hypothetical protein